MPVLNPENLSVGVYLLSHDDMTFVKAALKLARTQLNKEQNGGLIYILEGATIVAPNALPKRATSVAIVIEENNVFWATELLFHLNLEADNALTTAMTEKTYAVLRHHQSPLWIPNEFFPDLLAMTVTERQ